MKSGKYIRTKAIRKKTSDAHKGEKSFWYGKHMSEKTKKKISDGRIGPDNPAWKDNKVTYGALHDWVKCWLKKESRCASCGEKKPLDLANKSGKYLRDLSDWYWLCRKCHMRIDGRTEHMRQVSRNRRIPDKICLICGKIFHRTSDMRTAKYCGRSCAAKGLWKFGRKKKT